MAFISGYKSQKLISWSESGAKLLSESRTESVNQNGEEGDERFPNVFAERDDFAREFYGLGRPVPLLFIITKKEVNDVF